MRWAKIFMLTGSHIEYGTKTPELEPNQKITFYKDTFDISGNPQPNQPLHVMNQWENGARVGARCYNHKITGKDHFSPFYLSPEYTYGTTTKLTPGDSFTVFFASYVETGTIIDLRRTLIPYGRFRFTQGGNKCRISYNDKDLQNNYWLAVEGAEKF